MGRHAEAVGQNPCVTIQGSSATRSVAALGPGVPQLFSTSKPSQNNSPAKVQMSAFSQAVLAVLVLVIPTSLAARELNAARKLAACEQPQYSPLVPTITKAPVTDLHWLDRNDQNVIALTKKVGLDAGGFWVSSDGGKRWLDKTSQLNDSTPDTEVVEVAAVFSQTSNPANVVVFGAGTWFWTSSDYGNTVAAKQTATKWRGMSIRAYKVHPRQDSWLLILVKRPDCRATDRAMMECPYDLLLTKDLFDGDPMWQNLTAAAQGKIAGFVDFDWGMNGCPTGDCAGMMGSPKEESIVATIYAKPGDYDQPWDPDVHFVGSDNWFTTFTTHVWCGNKFEMIGSSIYLAVSNSCPTDINGKQKHEAPSFPQGITLYTSMDGGCTFVQACLPVAIKQEGYELLGAHDGTGVIVIVHYLVSDTMRASNVYMAGPHHAIFSLSLSDVYHSSFGLATDFALIASLPGVYIANRITSQKASSAEYDPYSAYGNYDATDFVDQPVVESRITFSGGAKWQRLNAPATFNNPTCNRCQGQSACYLHLHGLSSWDSWVSSVPAVYSDKSAPGVILASGNTGVAGVGLDDNDGLCTWLSTDGGMTWSDIAVGTYIYEFADWGGFIVLARHPGNLEKAAEEVIFSYDGGKCWQRVPLTEAFLVDNIRIEPDGQRPRVVVHGRRCRKSLHPQCAYDATAPLAGVLEGVMYTVDVQELMVGKMGLCAAPDMERWGVPKNVSTNDVRCVLGRQTFMERRKASSRCITGPDYKRPVPTKMDCNCSVDADLECDYGFSRTGGDGTCKAIAISSMPWCPVINSLAYTVSTTGKRLVHADSCLGVEALIPDTNGQGQPAGTPRSDGGGSGGGQQKKKHSAWFGFFMFLLVVCILGGGFTGWWIYLATESHRDNIRDVAAGVAGIVGNAKHWVQEKISGRPAPIAEQDLGFFQPLADSNGFADDGSDRSLFTLK